MEQPSVTVEALKGKGLVVCEFCLFGWGVLVGWLGGLFCCLFFFFSWEQIGFVIHTSLICHWYKKANARSAFQAVVTFAFES